MPRKSQPTHEEAPRPEVDEGADADQRPDEADQVEAAEPGSAPGYRVVEGATGTTVDQDDLDLGTLRVEVNSNVSLDNKVLTPGQKVEVRDTAEARACIQVGHLSLLDDDDELDAQPEPVHAVPADEDDQEPPF